MRFLLELVYCCGAGAAESERESEGESVSRGSSERRSLVPRCKRRLRSRSATGTEWRPSLGAISEDLAVPEKRRESHGPAVKRKTPATASKPARVHVRTPSDDFGRSNYTQAIPAFSPAPFMF